MHNYLEGTESFITCVDGIEYQSDIRYIPAVNGGRDEPSYSEAAELERVMFQGFDLTDHLHDGVKQIIVDRFLEKVRDERYANY